MHGSAPPVHQIALISQKIFISDDYKIYIISAPMWGWGAGGKGGGESHRPITRENLNGLFTWIRMSHLLEISYTQSFLHLLLPLIQV